MSWDLMVFASEAPASVLDARRLIDAWDDDEWRQPPADEVDERVRGFLHDLLAVYPSPESRNLDEQARSIWSVTPTPDSRVSVYMCMSWSSPPEVADLIVELVKQHGLVLYDPQGDQVQNPVWPPADGCRLTLENGSLSDEPSADQLIASLATLDGHHNHYAILEADGDHYVQAAVRREGPGIALEFRDGGPERHFTTNVDSIEAVQEAFVGFANGDERWRSLHEWERLVFG